MSIILAGAAWFVLLPTAAELCGLVGVQQGLMAIQVGLSTCAWPHPGIPVLVPTAPELCCAARQACSRA